MTVLYFLRDGTPATADEVYRLGGFQTDEEGARARGLPLTGPRPAAPVVDVKPRLAQTKPVRRRRP